MRITRKKDYKFYENNSEKCLKILLLSIEELVLAALASLDDEYRDRISTCHCNNVSRRSSSDNQRTGGKLIEF